MTCVPGKFLRRNEKRQTDSRSRSFIMNDSFRKILEEYTVPEDTVGLIGFGVFGRELHRTASEAHRKVLLYDPAEEFFQSEEEYADTMTLWGNGMGGCCTFREEEILFLPLPLILKRAKLISVQVPPDAGVIVTPEFCSAMRPDAVLVNFSGDGIVSGEVKDGRIIRG